MKIRPRPCWLLLLCGRRLLWRRSCFPRRAILPRLRLRLLRGPTSDPLPKLQVAEYLHDGVRNVAHEPLLRVKVDAECARQKLGVQDSVALVGRVGGLVFF